MSARDVPAPATEGELASDRAADKASYKDALKTFAHRAVDPLVRGLVALGLRADHLTIAGLVLSAFSGWAFYDGQWRLASLLLTLAGACDILDGQVARVSGRVTTFGAFLDSTLDRLAESFVLIGLAAFYAGNLLGLYHKARIAVEQVASGELEAPFAAIAASGPVPPEGWLALTVLCVFALTGSFMVSYTRARAEGLGFDCRVGWFERPERIVLLIVAGFVKAFWAMSAALILLTVFSFVTAAQRLLHVRRLATREAVQS